LNTVTVCVSLPEVVVVRPLKNIALIVQLYGISPT